MNLLQMAPMVLMVEKIGAGASASAYLMPLFSQHALLSALLTGQAVAPMALAASVFACVGGAALLVWFGTRRLASERFVFGL